MDGKNVLKRVFLRKILYRIDFQFITEQKQEEIYTYIAENYGDYFTDRGCEQSNSVDIEINMNTLNNPMFNSKPQTVYYLLHPKTEDSDGRILKIGKTFLFLDLDLGIETSGISYREWFADIIGYLSEMKLFRPTRMGLRKLNTFFMLDKNISNMAQIFSVPFFDIIKTESFELDHFNNMQTYTAEKYSLNFLRNYSTGYLNNPSVNNELGHQITFDFDLYMDDADVLNDFCKDGQKGLEEMNQIIYDFFSGFVTKEILEKIEAGDSLAEYNIIPF